MTWSNNRQIAALFKEQELKQYQLELLALLHDDAPEFKGTLLDLGCAAGGFLQAVKQRWPATGCVGVELSPQLAQEAVRRCADFEDIEIVVADVTAFRPDRVFDRITACGILSVFDTFEPVLERWLSWLTDNGILYIFGSFNSADVDLIIRYRNNYNSGEWESGLTSYSIRTVADWLTERGWRHSFRRFDLNMELPRSKDPMRSYTMTLQDGTRQIVSASNILTEFFFLKITR